MAGKGIRLGVLSLLALCIIIFAVFIGSVNISYFDVAVILADKITGFTKFSLHVDKIQKEIIWNLRLPRVLLAFLAGGGVSVGGAVVQSVLKNPLASPYTMGVSSGASLAVSIVATLGISVPALGIFFTPVVGFAAGMLAVFSVIAFTTAIDKNTTGTTIVLTGMVLSLFYNAVQTIVISFSQEDIKKIIMWQMGSFAMRGWSFVYAVLPFFLAGIGCLIFFAKELDVMTLGDEQALSIGVDVRLVMRCVLSLAAVLAGAAVAVCGIIGFVDLVTPHVARRIFGSKHIYVMPASVIIGGIIMVLADLISRTIVAPSELPVGAVTACIGAPFFAYIYFRERK